MTDYLAEAMGAGELLEETRRSDRKSAVRGRDMEKKGGKFLPLLEQVKQARPVFHPLGRPVEQYGALPRLRGTPLRELSPFPAPVPSVRRDIFHDVEAVDLAFQRDSRRYDGGFFLY